MSVLETEINLVDRMTAPLLNITDTLNNVLDNISEVNHALNSAFGGSGINSAKKSFSFINVELDEMLVNINQNAKAQYDYNNSVATGVSGTGKLLTKVKGLVESYVGFQGVAKMVALSDEMTQTTTRLNLMNDGLQTTQELQELIFNSAQRSRQPYMETADIVAKLGQSIGDVFSSNEETIQFAENLRKSFIIAGVSQEDTASSTLRLTEALASGVLHGEELKEIFKASPNIIQTLADYLEVPIENIQSMASEGLITADIFKNAIIGSTDKINADFENTSLTWGQIWHTIANNIIVAMQPVLSLISLLAQNWETLEPIVLSIAAAFGVYAIGLGAISVYTAITKIVTEGLFATLRANPLILIASLIGIVIGVIYKWVQSVGGLQIAWAIVTNYLRLAWDGTKIMFFTGVYFVIDLINKLQLGWKTAGVNIANFIGAMKVNVLTILQNMTNGAIDIINAFIIALRKIPGVSIDTINHVTFATDAALQEEAAKQARAEELTAYQDEIESNIAERQNDLTQMKNDMIERFELGQAEIVRNNGSPSNNVTGDSGTNEELMAVAANTGAIKDTLDVSNEHLKYVRELAEQGVINKFTLADLKVEQTNNINNEDKEGMISITDKLADELLELVNVTARGV